MKTELAQIVKRYVHTLLAMALSLHSFTAQFYCTQFHCKKLLSGRHCQQKLLKALCREQWSKYKGSIS